MRIRTVLALMVASLLLSAGVASAQDTTTEPLSDYTSTTPTVTTPKTTTTNAATTTPAAQGQGDVAPSAAGQEQSNVAPSVAAQPAASSPSTLAFTGAEPLVLIILGLVLVGGTATLLVRDRRRSDGR